MKKYEVLNETNNKVWLVNCQLINQTLICNFVYIEKFLTDDVLVVTDSEKNESLKIVIPNELQRLRSQLIRFDAEFEVKLIN